VEQRDNSADQHVKIRLLDHIDRQEEEREKDTHLLLVHLSEGEHVH
jgi:hypothetical protein